MNKTLLVALFVNPTPLPHLQHIYHALRNRIFPGKENFIEFLETQDATVRNTATGKILKRLCFESNYTPPFPLLNNIIAAEHDTLNQSSSGYLPQDHYVHIVNMYLLGIYVFFYHIPFNHHLTNHFFNKRKEYVTNRNMQSVKDFLSSWKYFCLYHDIAYPIEIGFDKKKRSRSSFVNKYIRIFSSITEMFCTERVACALSKLCVLKDLLEDKFNNSLKSTLSNCNIEFECYGGEIRINEICVEYGDYTQINKLFSYDNFKLVVNFIQKNDYITVLSDRASGNPISIKVHNGKTDKIYTTKDISLARNAIQSLLGDCDDFDEDKYSVSYYIKNIENKFSYILSTLGINENQFDTFYNGIGELEKKAEQGVSYNVINTSSLLFDYTFHKYEIVLEYLKCLLNIDNNKLFHVDKKYENQIDSCDKFKKDIKNRYIRDKVLEYLQKEIAVFANSLISDELKNAVKADAFTYDNIKQKISSSLAESIKTNVYDTLSDDIATKCVDKMISAIAHDVKMAHDSIEVVWKIRENLQLLDIDKFKFKFSPQTIQQEANDTYNKLKNSDVLKPVIEEFEKKFLDVRKLEISNLINEYTILHSLCDHGIWSFLIFLVSQRCLFSMNTLSADKNDAHIKTKCLAWGMVEADAAIKFHDNYHFIASEACNSILCHNIYSLRFKTTCNKPWMTKLHDVPFVYFCSLLDALQHVSRYKYFNYKDFSGNTSYPQPFSYSDVDIVVDKDKLIMKFVCKMNEITDIKKKYIDSLDDYIKCCTDFLKIEIST